jgi:hypothetical protein
VAIARVRAGAAPDVSFVWEERALADAPPPAVTWDGADLVVAAYTKRRDARVLEVVRIAGEKESARYAYAQSKDESFDFDLAPGLVVWDEDAPTGDGRLRAVLKVDAIPPSGKAQIVTPETSDVDEPRLAARPGGFWLAWIARKPEPLRDAAPELEGPGERRTHAWLEIVPLDAAGKPSGPVMRVAEAGSRVEAFDLATRGDTLTVLVKDDEALADNAGSRLVVYDGEKTRVLVADGAGRGIPDLLGRVAAFRDEQDHARLVPLAGTDDPRPSLEPALDGARTLADIGGQILAGFPGDPGRALRVVSCGGTSRSLPQRAGAKPDKQ